MNKYQNMILWIGLALVLVYMFAGNYSLISTFTKSSNTIPPGPALTMTDLGIPTTTGNGHSNTGNTGSAKTTLV